MNAEVGSIFPDAMGRFFLPGCFLSDSLSERSLSMYPTEAIKEKEKKASNPQGNYSGFQIKSRQKMTERLPDSFLPSAADEQVERSPVRVISFLNHFTIFTIYFNSGVYLKTRWQKMPEKSS